MNAFDRWTLVHLAFWITAAAGLLLAADRGVSLKKAVALCLLSAFAWECLESVVAPIDGVWPPAEAWINRWVTDPATSIVGVLAVWVPARAFRRTRSGGADDEAVRTPARSRRQELRAR